MRRDDVTKFAIVEYFLHSRIGVLMAEMVGHVEHQYIRKALKKARGNVGRCARICGLSRRSITAKIAEYKLDKKAFKET